MIKIVNELLSRMRAGLYATLDDNGQLACVHRHDRDLLEVVGCGILLQHHLYTINGPEQAPEAVDEPVYDETAPEHNVELADTNTLTRTSDRCVFDAARYVWRS